MIEFKWNKLTKKFRSCEMRVYFKSEQFYFCPAYLMWEKWNKKLFQNDKNSEQLLLYKKKVLKYKS